MMLSIQACLTPRRLAIVEHKVESARDSTPAPKMGQMERSDAFSVPTPDGQVYTFFFYNLFK